MASGGPQYQYDGQTGGGGGNQDRSLSADFGWEVSSNPNGNEKHLFR
jgi:hypothetical protein